MHETADNVNDMRKVDIVPGICIPFDFYFPFFIYGSDSVTCQCYCQNTIHIRKGIMLKTYTWNVKLPVISVAMIVIIDLLYYEYSSKAWNSRNQIVRKYECPRDSLVLIRNNE